MLFDTNAGTWVPLPGSKFGYSIWSRDSRYIYTFRNEGEGPQFYRVNVSAKQVEEVLRLPGFRLLDRWIGLHPDGSLLVAQNTGIQEVYTLKLDKSLQLGARSSGPR